MLLLAAYLERHSTHEVAILDTLAEELSYEEIARRVDEAAPDVVGISVMTQTLIDVLRVIEVVRAMAPDARIVLGGPHVHLFPEETIRLPGADFLVLGEGEYIFKELLDHIDDRAALKSISGLVFLENGHTIHTGAPAFIEDLDALPFPARHLTDVQLYDSVLSWKSRIPISTFTVRSSAGRTARGTNRDTA